LERLGFRGGENCVVFNRSDFREKLDEYLRSRNDPKWRRVREAGRELIREKHTVEHRIQLLVRLAEGWKGRRSRDARDVKSIHG
jgi:spore maturation protein CgeB